MKLIKDVRPENIEGQWFKYPDESGEIELKIRAISPSKATEIERKHLGRSRSFKFNEKEGTRVVDIDTQALERIALEKAGFALIDSKNAEVEVGDEDARTFYSKLTRREVSVGDMVSLDGLWVPELKDRIFRDAGDIVAFVIEKSSAAGQEKAAEDAALSKRAD